MDQGEIRNKVAKIVAKDLVRIKFEILGLLADENREANIFKLLEMELEEFAKVVDQLEVELNVSLADEAFHKIQTVGGLLDAFDLAVQQMDLIRLRAIRIKGLSSGIDEMMLGRITSVPG